MCFFAPHVYFNHRVVCNSHVVNIILVSNYAETKFENLDDFIDKVCKLTERLVHWKATMIHILGGLNWAAGTMNPDAPKTDSLQQRQRRRRQGWKYRIRPSVDHVGSMDAGTLKFWVDMDGKPHGPGYSSGVTGPLRWGATALYDEGNAECCCNRA